MRTLVSAFVLAVLVHSAPVSAGELKLSMEGGLVTLVAKDVPLSAVMAEWARIGKTTIVNGDKILTPVTLEFDRVPERKALDILLRAAAGYILAERPTPLAGASAFDRIMILPTSRPPANAPPLQAPPTFAAPRGPMPMPVPVQPDPDEPEPGMPGVQPPPAGAAPGSPVPGQPGMQPPAGPLTAPRPGQLPAPQQPVPFGSPRPGGPGGPGTPGGPPTGPGGGGGGGGVS